MEINIVHCEKVYIVIIDCQATIKELKEAIKEQMKLKAPIDNFILKYNYRNLDKEFMTIDSYFIRNKSYIGFRNIIDKPSINLKFRDESIELIFPCFCCYSILDYKNEIKKKEDIQLISNFYIKMKILRFL